jgi:hypothetical protein
MIKAYLLLKIIKLKLNLICEEKKKNIFSNSN